MSTTAPASVETVFAVLDAVPGRGEDLAAAITTLAPQVRAEAGCLQFIPRRSTDHPDRFYIYEVYTDAAAFEQHLTTDHVRHFIRRLDDVSTDGRTAADRTAPLPHDPEGTRA